MSLTFSRKAHTLSFGKSILVRIFSAQEAAEDAEAAAALHVAQRWIENVMFEEEKIKENHGHSSEVQKNVTDI